MVITNTWSVSDMQRTDSDGDAAATTVSGTPW